MNTQNLLSTSSPTMRSNGPCCHGYSALQHKPSRAPLSDILLDWIQGFAFCMAIVIFFGIVGGMDYRDAKQLEQQQNFINGK